MASTVSKVPRPSIRVMTRPSAAPRPRTSERRGAMSRTALDMRMVGLLGMAARKDGGRRPA